MEFFLQDTSFLVLILAIVSLIGVLLGWSLRASLSERPILEAYERLEQDRNSLARLFAKIKDQHELRTNEVKKLNQEIMMLKQDLSAQAMDSAVQESTTQAYIARLEKAESDVQHANEKMALLEEQSNNLRNRNTKLLSDMDRLREELKAWMTLNRDFAGLQQQLQQLEATNHQLEKERLLYREKLELAQSELNLLQRQLLRLDASSLGTAAAPTFDKFQAPSTHPPVPAGDSLQRIRGISEQTELQLRAMGIQTFEQISRWNEKNIQAVSKALDCSPEKIIDENWIGQAMKLTHFEDL
ncbi:MAG: hypothetical protein R2792_02325 [Saprospiraceae bacterium]